MGIIAVGIIAVGIIYRRHWPFAVGIVAVLMALMALSACGQTTSQSTNGAGAGLHSIKTPSTQSTGAAATPSPTEIPLPYSFPKQWSAAPDGADLPQSPAMVGSFAFASSAPQTGYFCVVTPSTTDADNSPHVPPAVSATHDGGQTWSQVSGAASRFKSICQIIVDANNPNDLFVSAGKVGSPDPTPNPLFRSQDGGASWTTITQPTISGNTTYIVGLAVVQSRLLMMIAPAGEAGPPTYSLFASDDGGHIWNPLTVSMNGQQLSISAQLWVASSTIYIEAGPPCQNCGYALAPANSLGETTGRIRAMPRNAPRSSQPPTPTYLFKSSDGGRSWAQLPVPATNFSNFTVMRSADGATTYALCTVLGAPNQPANVNLAYYSTNGGASWRTLPTLVGVENGYPDPGSLGAFGTYLLPDGSVITTAFHTAGTTYGGDAGAFLLHPGDANPSWQPLIRSLSIGTIQPTATSSGARIWAMRPVPEQAGGALIYFDVP